MSHRFDLYAALLLLAVTPAALALETEDIVLDRTSGLAWGIGLEYESGDYGTGDTTTLWTIPFTLSYSTDKFMVGVTVEYLSAESTGTIIVSSHNGGHMTSTRVSPASQSASGIGDVRAYATYYLPQRKKSVMQDYLTAYVKFGTADENKGLGTGATDYGVEYGLMLPQSKQLDLFASIGYEISGDTAATDYDNVLFGELGLVQTISATRRAGAYVSYSQASVAGADAYLDITGFMTIEYDKKRDYYLYLLLGLSDSAPDYGAGINLRHAF